MSAVDKFKNVWTQCFPPRRLPFTEASVPAGSQTGRTFIVTGGNNGIGYELCKLLFGTGATVYMGARSTEKAEAAIESIKESVEHPVTEGGQLKVLLIDLSDLRSVKDAAETFARQESKLHVLWNNAGMGPNAVKVTDRTAQGIEPMLGVHCVAAHFLAELLLPQLRAAANGGPNPRPARVIWLTSALADTSSPYNGIDISILDTGTEDAVLNYAASKAGAWILSREYQKRRAEDGIVSLAVNPGNCDTGTYRGTNFILALILKALMLYPAELGALTELFAGLSPSIMQGSNGIYVIPWGRTRLDEDTIRQDILTAAKSEEEGGLGYGCFSEDLDNHGTYDGCYSYFEVALVNPAARERLPRRHLQYNRHGVSQPFPHEIIWNSDGSNVEDKGWLASIRAGDTIQIIPMTRFSGWKNYVYSAEIIARCEDINEADVISPLSALTLSGPSQNPSAVYRTLEKDTKEIRLITLLSGDGDEPVRCQLGYAHLAAESLHKYECLSYCWGNTMDLMKICLGVNDGAENDDEQPKYQDFLITGNLHSAFRRLRFQDGRERTLWVDAICINQDDMVERGEQVSMMRQIYARASNVVIWLGEADGDSKAFLRAALEIAHQHADGDAARFRGLSLDHRLDELHCPIKPIYDDWGSLDLLFLGREWFRRIWVVQEVSQAASAVVQCGEVELPWSLVLRMNLCMRRPATWSVPWRRTVIPGIWQELFEADKYDMDPLGLKFPNPVRSTQMDILDTFLHGLDLEATDYRDKIYALLGFIDPDDVSIEIRPDYAKAVEAVFADFTRWWIRTRRSLRILSAIHASSGRSWQDMSAMPRETASDKRPSWSLWYDGRSSWANATLGVWSNTNYRASADRGLDIVESTSEKLSLRGCSLGTINSISTFPYFGAHSDDSEDSENDENRTGNNEEITNDDFFEIRNVYTNLFEPTNARNIWTSNAFQPGKLDQSGQAVELAEDMLFDHEYCHEESSGATTGCACHHSAFFHTSEGARGLCPPMASEGDIVVVLYGGRVPYILRRLKSSVDDIAAAGNEYHFIGECYLQGYMHGLAVAQVEDGNHERSTELFDLF
ncbi:putative Heterokaryon incompatibility domain-containing protein [Seiridium unicorne]|uniref:Heterokaryon incompatibility domain-containing protein n=1 Tax=Seiridium unicorne TaxID=138068 RepID=A0ABR2UGJ6_9PEZI